MSIRRVVPNINSERVDESRESYTSVLGFELVMDLGFVLTFASPTNPTAQITIMRSDGSSGPVPRSRWRSRTWTRSTRRRYGGALRSCTR